MSTMHWRKATLSSLVLMLSLTNTGCGNFQLFPETKTIDYKSAGKLPPLEIPPDLVQPAIDERYTIPEGGSGTATFSSYSNERGNQSKTSNTAFIPSSVQNVHIERAGTQRWLVVPQPPEALWPVIKEFWQELGFLIKTEVPEAGIMETDWAENRAKIPHDLIRTFLSTFLDSIYSTAERDKFRTRLERNEQGNTEIYISHRGMSEVLEGGSLNRTVWQPKPADPDLEAEMLSRLMMRFGVEEEKAKMELTSGRSTTQERAYIESGTDNALVINEAFDRSWRRIGLALDRIGFTVEDRNRAEGIYFVRYLNPDKDIKKKSDDEGILSGLMFWRSDDSNDKAAKYRIQVNNTGTSTSKVTLSNEDGSAVSSATAKRILTLLHDQLK